LSNSIIKHWTFFGTILADDCYYAGDNFCDILQEILTVLTLTMWMTISVMMSTTMRNVIMMVAIVVETMLIPNIAMSANALKMV
jgi:hypothetical protein